LSRARAGTAPLISAIAVPSFRNSFMGSISSLYGVDH
jgi:hypothetical protein